ncbi:MAG: hypothetical protein ABEJ68_04885 [Halobacteriaceae archaeon]
MTRRWVAVGAVLVAILLASLVPTGGGGGGLPLATLGHLLGYAALTAALAAALDRPLVVAVAAAVLAGAGVEVIQPTVGRDASLADALTNAVGAAAAWLALRAR